MFKNMGFLPFFKIWCWKKLGMQKIGLEFKFKVYEILYPRYKATHFSQKYLIINVLKIFFITFCKNAILGLLLSPPQRCQFSGLQMMILKLKYFSFWYLIIWEQKYITYNPKRSSVCFSKIFFGVGLFFVPSATVLWHAVTHR